MAEQNAALQTDGIEHAWKDLDGFTGHVIERPRQFRRARLSVPGSRVRKNPAPGFCHQRFGKRSPLCHRSETFMKQNDCCRTIRGRSPRAALKPMPGNIDPIRLIRLPIHDRCTFCSPDLVLVTGRRVHSGVVSADKWRPNDIAQSMAMLKDLAGLRKPCLDLHVHRPAQSTQFIKCTIGKPQAKHASNCNRRIFSTRQTHSASQRRIFPNSKGRDSWPGLLEGTRVISHTEGLNLPIAGFAAAARSEESIELPANRLVCGGTFSPRDGRRLRAGLCHDCRGHIRGGTARRHLFSTCMARWSPKHLTMAKGRYCGDCARVWVTICPSPSAWICMQISQKRWCATRAPSPSSEPIRISIWRIPAPAASRI